MAGIFLGSLVGGRLTDRLGRRVMFIVDVAAIGLTLDQACALPGIPKPLV
jgi:MFS family permease